MMLSIVLSIQLFDNNRVNNNHRLQGHLKRQACATISRQPRYPLQVLVPAGFPLLSGLGGLGMCQIRF